MKDQVAVLYGPKGGNTEKVATLISKKIGTDKSVLIPVTEVEEHTLDGFSKLIIGSSTIGTHTWAQENTSHDWDEFLPKFRKIDLKGKKIAIFGLGDQIAYTNHFVDHMRIIFDVVVENHGEVIGSWPTDGYEFNESASIIDKKFIGLPIDEDFQDELTEQRIEHWVKEIVNDFGK